MAGHPVLSKCRLQSFDVFGKHLTTSDIFQNYDRKDACDKPYKCDICDEVRFLTYRITLEHQLAKCFWRRLKCEKCTDHEYKLLIIAHTTIWVR
jgi:hypothetical protein